jgi:hypothetical protein
MPPGALLLNDCRVFVTQLCIFIIYILYTHTAHGAEAFSMRKKNAKILQSISTDRDPKHRGMVQVLEAKGLCIPQDTGESCKSYYHIKQLVPRFQDLYHYLYHEDVSGPLIAFLTGLILKRWSFLWVLVAWWFMDTRPFGALKLPSKWYWPCDIVLALSGLFLWCTSPDDDIYCLRNVANVLRFIAIAFRWLSYWAVVANKTVSGAYGSFSTTSFLWDWVIGIAWFVWKFKFCAQEAWFSVAMNC